MHTRTDVVAVLWSMNPWAGLKRFQILEACCSSLMSNLPHQKTFIPINKAFDKGVLHLLSTVCVRTQQGMLACGELSQLVFIVDVCIYILHFKCHFEFKCVWFCAFLLFYWGVHLDEKCRTMFKHFTDVCKQTG